MSEVKTELQQEDTQVKSLLEKGMSFTAGNKTFVIREPYLGTLDRLAELYIQMEIDQVEFDEGEERDRVSAINNISKKSAKNLARIVAVSVLNSKWKIKFLTGLLTKFFLWKITPSKLRQIVQIIILINNRPDFISSIRLIAGIKRMTKPNPIEQNS